MLLVRGMGVVDQLKPDWREFFSVYGDGTIDLRTAFKDTLIAVTGASPNDVENYVARRDGDVPKLEGCAARAAEILGWRASRSLEQMCRDGWAWQSANPSGYAS